MDNNGFGARLRELRKSRNETQPMLASTLQISRSAVSMYESGAREPDFETLEAIADHYNVDMNYLMGWTDDPYDYDGDPDNRFDSIPCAQFEALRDTYHDNFPRIWRAWQEMQQEAYNESGKLSVVPDSPESQADFPQVRYAGPVAAHFDAMLVEEYEYRPVLPEWIGRRKPEDFFIASVDGDSMYPHFQHGDEILCLKCSDMGLSGRVGIMLLGDGEATLKKIEYKRGEDWLDLVPINPEYQTKRIEGADLEQCRVLGRVLRVIRTVDEM